MPTDDLGTYRYSSFIHYNPELKKKKKIHLLKKKDKKHCDISTQSNTIQQ